MTDGFASTVDSGRFEDLWPQVLLPTQYTDMCRNAQARPPELRLRLAILEDAVRCYQRNVNGTRPRARRIFSETEEWFAADEPEEPFSFASICAVLDIDCDFFRAGLRRWRAQGAWQRPGARSHPLPARRVAGARNVASPSDRPVRQSA